MEVELKCPVCDEYYSNAVLIPCNHTLCLNCALTLQQSVSLNQTTVNSAYDDSVKSNADRSGTASVSTCCSSNTESELSDADKLSLLSETDSGVICNSRPNSYVGTPSFQGILFPPIHIVNAISITCPVCHKITYLDENGSYNLPKNRTMQNIIDKYCENKNIATHCQLCERNPKEAVVMCEQCEIYYCESCLDSCHPKRGPLAKHSLIAPKLAKMNLRSRTMSKDKSIKCVEHSDSPLINFCIFCKSAICNVCSEDGRHSGHDIQSISTICKVLKTELSQNLQILSERAKYGTEFIQRLKGITEKTNENSANFETELSSQCDILIQAIQTRKQQLLAFARKEKDYKLRVLKDQVCSCTTKLQQTTGLIQFCIEALKETDANSYLQVGSSLISRVSNADITWNKELNTLPWISPEFDLTLDCQPVLMAIDQLTFAQMKPPGAPILIADQCMAQNNSITVAWHSHPSSFVEGFILELDDGNNGAFREVYCGKETICRVDGLHFNCIYRIRVKSFNSSGEGLYSVIISLQTADVAWFVLDPLTSHNDILISNENQTITCESYEHRVVLGNIGFSRGVHYWEINIDRYHNNADIAFGIAKCEVSKDKMLGKDEYGWSMYIDNKRSWFLHADHHDNRTDGGIEAANVIGVLLNLELLQLSFYVNDERQGPIAFSELKGVFYPAISLNRNVQVTVTTGLEPPISSGANSLIESESSDGETKPIIISTNI